VYVLTSHCNFKTCVNVPHVNKTVTDSGGIYTDILPVATPLFPIGKNLGLGIFGVPAELAHQTSQENLTNKRHRFGSSTTTQNNRKHSAV